MRSILILLICLMSFSSVSKGQGCSVCTKTAAGLDDKGAKGMNAGILYLALIPLAMIGTIGFIWWKYQKQN